MLLQSESSYVSRKSKIAGRQGVCVCVCVSERERVREERE